MLAAIYRQFREPISVETVPDPTPGPGSIILKVEATGICRSDWHGWMGHDQDIILPHVPGHELAGTIMEIGKDVKNWQIGDRVTLPFVCGCGHCQQCQTGNEQVCDNQFQPGFTGWGSFAEFVEIKYAENNLVKLPEHISFSAAASLGCRFITSFRAIVDQAKVQPGNYVAVHGCGGVGLSAIMIAKAHGAVAIAVDIDDTKLATAKKFGADYTVNAINEDVAVAIKSLTSGGAQISVDAFGSHETAINSIKSLRKHGKHIQVGLMAGKHENPPMPMHLVIANELEIIGSHGMQAHRYAAVFKMLQEAKIDMESFIEKKVNLVEGTQILMKMDEFPLHHGIAVINNF